MKRLGIVIFVMFLCGCASKPVMNLQNEYVPTKKDGAQFSIKDVEAAILSASQKRGWSSRIIKTGLIDASISVRTHQASVEIPYTRSNYSIIYKSSENLGYQNGNIHRNYNNWVLKLSRTIQEELGVRSQKY